MNGNQNRRRSLMAGFLLLALAGAARAAAPVMLTYQGRLKESGLPVSALRTIDLQLCDAPAPGGTCYDAGSQGVAVTNGLFRVTFAVPAGVNLETGTWYLEVHVGASTFLPREQLSASPFAVYSSSASTLIAAPGAANVTISTAVVISAQDAAGYSLTLSSGISTPNGTVTAKYFVGNGSGLTGLSTLDGTKVARTGDSMSGTLNMVGAAINLTGSNGTVTGVSSMTASAFFGDGSHLTGVTASGAVAKTGDTMTGQLTNASTVTILGAGAGSSALLVNGGIVASSAAFGYGVFAATAAFPGGVQVIGAPTYGYFSSGPLFDFYGNGGSRFGSYVSVGAGTSGKLNVQGTGSSGALYVSTDTSGGSANLMVGNSGFVGVGAAAPAARLHLSSGTLLADGTFDQGAPSGPGTRFVWLPSSGAVRGGLVTGAQWDPANIGAKSVAFGEDNLASASYATVSGGLGNVANMSWGVVGGGDNNINNSFAGTISGGLGNLAGGSYATVPGGTGNTAMGNYSFAAGIDATAAAVGSFVWADSAGGGGVPITNNVADSFLVRSMGGFDIQSNAYHFSNGVSTFVFINNTGMAMATGSSITLSGAGGVIVGQSSITASAFFGDGSHLLGVNAASAANAVSKTGDTMTGPLDISGSSLTVTGPGPASPMIVSTSNSAGVAGLYVDSNNRVGVGFTSPGAKLEVGASDDFDGLRVNGPSIVGTGKIALSVGGLGSVGIDRPGTPFGRLIMTENGNLGVGVVSPDANSVIDASGSIYQRPSITANTNGYMKTNASNILNTVALNPGVLVADGGGSVFGLDKGFNMNTSRFRTRLFTAGSTGADISFASAVPSPTLQIDFADLMVIRGDTGDVGIGNAEPATKLDVSGNVQWGLGAVRSTMTNTGGIQLADGAGIVLKGDGQITTGSSITASAFFGDASHLLNGPPDNTRVLKAGDTMTGSLSITPGGLSVNSGAIYATGILDTLGALTGPGTRFMWIPSSAAFRAGMVGNTEWNVIGPQSVAFGSNNTASGNFSAAGGGEGNSATMDWSTVAGGHLNQATQQYAAVAGGNSNTASGFNAFIGAGSGNNASGNAAVIAGGVSNNANSLDSAIGGGLSNGIPAGADYAVIAGGANNIMTAGALYGAIGGGQNNNATASWATVPGGYNNQAKGAYSHAAGYQAIANFAGDFVWNDEYGSLSSNAPDQFLLKAAGGFEAISSSFSFMSYAMSPLLTVDASSAVFGVPIWGDGSHLTGVIAPGAVAKTGDTMTGGLVISAGGLSVAGNTTSNSYSAPQGAQIRWDNGSFLAGITENYTGGGTDDLSFFTGSSAGAPRMTIAGNGKVGLNTAAPQTLLEVNGNAQFGAGATKSTFTAAGGLTMASGAPITLSGPLGFVTTASSVTASSFFGDGSHLTAVISTSAVAKTGDVMTGNLGIVASTFSVSGPIISSGTGGGVTVSGPGTRFEWIPALAALRAGNALGAEWDSANIGPNSVAFGQNVTASNQFASVTGGSLNSVSRPWATISGGYNNSIFSNGDYGHVGGGYQNWVSGTYSVIPGGFNNQAIGNQSFAAGSYAIAHGNGEFVWSDSLGTNLDSYIPNQFLVRAMGGFDVIASSFVFSNATSTMMYVAATGVGIGTTSPVGAFTVNAPAVAAIGETVAKFGVSDASSEGLLINNGNGSDLQFSPKLLGNTIGAGGFTFEMNGLGTDGTNTDSFIMNATNNGSTFFTRRLLDVRNAGVSKFTINPYGYVGIGTNNPLLNLSLGKSSATIGVEDASSGIGSTMTVRAGGAASGDGGPLLLAAGAAGGASGNGGAVVLTAGMSAPTSGNGGSVVLVAGNSVAAGKAGDIVLQPGGGPGSAKVLIDGTSSNAAHLKAVQPSVPSASANGSCGTSPSVSVQPGGTDMAGVVSFNPGAAGPTSAACTITINFVRAFSNTAAQPLKVLVTPNDSSTASLFLWATPAVGPNSGSLTIGMSNAPTLSVGYSFSYLVIE